MSDISSNGLDFSQFVVQTGPFEGKIISTIPSDHLRTMWKYAEDEQANAAWSEYQFRTANGTHFYSSGRRRRKL